MKKKYLHFLLFFTMMTLAADIAFSIPSLAGNAASGGYILYTGKVVGIMLAIIIGYLKLGSFKD